MYKVTLALGLFLTYLQASAQNTEQGSWIPVNESSIQLTGKRQIVPQKYIAVKTHLGELQEKLLSAPNEKHTQINRSTCVITLPLPNGSFERFRVVNSPVMEDELAKAFPNIKTFSVKGIDNPYAGGKIDLNEFGFHAMILSPNGDFFIDPYCCGNTADYICYYTFDFRKDPTQIIPEAGLINDSTEQRRPASMPSQARAATCVGANLYTYRLAVACTGEYAVAATGIWAPSVAQTLSKIVTTINRVNAVYEKEVSARMVLVSTETNVVFTNASSDPFTGNSNASTLLNESQTVITNSIGASNFDIGHTFSTGGGGLAYLNGVCKNNDKARGITGNPSPYGDPYDIDYVSHEMGHQFGATHTFNTNAGACNGNRASFTAVEPGSGITIMGYAGICGSENLASNSIPYFHAVSYDQIVNFIGASSCAVVNSTGNKVPSVTAISGYIVPVSTPFILSGVATDDDGDPLTFSWEETDAGSSASNWNAGTRPYFMSYPPVTNPTRYFPKLSVANSGNYTSNKGEYLPATPQQLSFRLTARDNKMGGGGVCSSQITLTVDASGPLKVTHPSTSGINLLHGTTQNITWDVNGTNQLPVQCDTVRILISYDSGNTYSVITNSTPNDGQEPVTLITVSTAIFTCRIKVEAKGKIFYDVGDNVFAIYPEWETSVKDFSTQKEMGFFAWPNPANDQLNFKLEKPGGNTGLSIEIRDVTGRMVTKADYKEFSGSVDVSKLPAGLYFIAVKGSEQRFAYRFIRQ